MRLRTRLKLYWLGLDNLDRVSVVCAVIVIVFALFLFAFLFEIV
jgi:hypothetical protein